MIGRGRQRDVIPDTMVTGGIGERERDPDEWLTDPELEAGRDLDRRGLVRARRPIGYEAHRPVVSPKDLQAAADRSALDQGDDDRRGRLHETVRVRRPVVVRIPEV